MISRSSIASICLILLVIPFGCAPSVPSLTHKLPASQQGSWQRHKPFQARVTPDTFDEARLRAALFYATSSARKRLGQSRPQRSDLLEGMAQDYAERMRDKKFVAHEDPYDRSRRTPKDRATRIGIKNPMVSENLATNSTIDYRSGQRVYSQGAPGKFSLKPGGPELPAHTYASLANRLVQQWLDSPGHRRNLLSPQVIELGCGVAFQWENNFPIVYAVQNFQLYEPATTKAPKK